MATVEVKVRALKKGYALENDIVVVPVEGRDVRFAFNISAQGTADADVVTTKIDVKHQANFEAAVTAKVGVFILNNPAWDSVKTDADGDGVSDEDGTRYGWSKNEPLYEIVA